MKTKGKTDGDKIAFKFASASNLKSEKEMHMHDVTYTFVDKDTLKAEWTHYDDGKPAGTAVFELKRKNRSANSQAHEAKGWGCGSRLNTFFLIACVPSGRFLT